MLFIYCVRVVMCCLLFCVQVHHGFNISIETDRLIKKGEPIYVDYQSAFWAGDEDEDEDGLVQSALYTCSLCHFTPSAVP